MIALEYFALVSSVDYRSSSDKGSRREDWILLDDDRDCLKEACRSWYSPSVAWVLLATLGLQTLLYLSQTLGGLGRGRVALITVAATALPLWLVALRLFRAKSRYDLRTLLLAVVVVAMPRGWMGRDFEHTRQQRAAFCSPAPPRR